MSSSTLALPVSSEMSPDIAEHLLQPQDLLPHAPATDADNLIIAPWLAPEEEVEPVRLHPLFRHILNLQN